MADCLVRTPCRLPLRNTSSTKRKTGLVEWTTNSNVLRSTQNPCQPNGATALIPFTRAGVAVETTDHVQIDDSFSPFCPEVANAVNSLQAEFSAIDVLVARNIERVLKAFSNARVGPHHFSSTTGYGHSNGGGREALDSIFAEISGSESAIVRSQIFSGTHAIACALYAVLRPGDELLAVVGPPYDTLEEVIGTRGTKGEGSLREFGVSYREVPVTPQGEIDWDALSTAVQKSTKCALIQRSCGYNASRKTLTIAEIQKAVEIIKAQNSNCVVMVDNCYGEFVDVLEPTAVGADLMAGSLIKNPGGTLAPSGGYVAGKAHLVQAAHARLASPGIGMEAGATAGDVLRLMMQGLFMGPQIVGEALKSSLLIAEVMSKEGFKVSPPPRIQRHDIIQVPAVQSRCPVGAYIQPVGGATAGYESQVVFADGTFIDGSTLELSCDGPLREPYAVFCQGGTHWTHWALVLGTALEAMREV